jgi:group I intron endonuclease
MVKASGVYKIINIITDQVYFGSSVNMKKRFNEHFARLRAGKHINSKLQRSFNKYGESAFKFEVVEQVEDFVEREQFYIDNHKPYFNICLRANDISSIIRTPEWGKNISIANTGRKASDETRERLRISHLGKSPGNKGIPHTEETKRKVSESKKGTIPWNKGIKTGRNEKQIAAVTGRVQSQGEKNKRAKSLVGKKSIPVIQMSLDKKIIKEFPSVTDALKICTGVANVLTGRSKTANGYFWIYKKDLLCTSA